MKRQEPPRRPPLVLLSDEMRRVAAELDRHAAGAKVPEFVREKMRLRAEQIRQAVARRCSR